jgi:hypothetical protein
MQIYPTFSRKKSVPYTPENIIHYERQVKAIFSTEISLFTTYKIFVSSATKA